MSVAVVITYRDDAGPNPGREYLPVATEGVFSKYWLTAAKALGCVWLPLYQTGAPVALEDLPAVRAELAQVRDYFARLLPDQTKKKYMIGTRGVDAVFASDETVAHLRERSRWLVDELVKIDPATIRELFIG
jgi:hypothetical protein